MFKGKSITVFNTRTDKVLLKITGKLQNKLNGQSLLITLWEDGLHIRMITVWLNETMTYIEADVRMPDGDEYYHSIFGPLYTAFLDAPV